MAVAFSCESCLGKACGSVWGVWGRANGRLERSIWSLWGLADGKLEPLNKFHTCVVPGAAPALAKAGVGGYIYIYNVFTWFKVSRSRFKGYMSRRQFDNRFVYIYIDSVCVYACISLFCDDNGDAVTDKFGCEALKSFCINTHLEHHSRRLRFPKFDGHDACLRGRTNSPPMRGERERQRQRQREGRIKQPVWSKLGMVEWQ